MFEHETNDGADALVWAASLEGSNGRVGMYGFSYQAATQLLALARAEDAKEEVTGLFERVDLVAVARNVAESNVPVALDTGVELEFDARKAAIHISTVETLAHELIVNAQISGLVSCGVTHN